MHEEIRERLVEVATDDQTIPYSHVAPLAGLDLNDPSDRAALADILGDKLI